VEPIRAFPQFLQCLIRAGNHDGIEAEQETRQRDRNGPSEKF
jgi:hypothetical protein